MQPRGSDLFSVAWGLKSCNTGRRPYDARRIIADDKRTLSVGMSSFRLLIFDSTRSHNTQPIFVRALQLSTVVSLIINSDSNVNRVLFACSRAEVRFVWLDKVPGSPPVV